MEKQIKLVSKPVIEHQLIEIGKEVTERIEGLNIDNLVATQDAHKSLKAMRADLNKESKEFETQRTMIKKAILTPYNEFESLYKTEILDKYKDAGGKLKTKIDKIEIELKQNKLDELEEYFNEKKDADDVPWIKFNKVIQGVDLTTSVKKYKQNINAFFEILMKDLQLIEANEYSTEVLIEYKKTLDVSKSILDVKSRKDEEKRIEKEKKKKALEARVKYLLELGMQQDEMTGTYVYDDDIYIDSESVKNLDKDTFIKKYNEIKTAIATKIVAQNAEEEVKETPKQVEYVSPPKQVEYVSPPKQVEYVSPPKEEKSAPLKAPVEEKKPEILNASFKAFGTLAQLKGLAAYMKENGIKYETIK